MTSPSRTDLAYMAGIVDGEGSISMTKITRDNSWRLVIQVGVCDRELIEWIAERFAGSVRYEIPARKTNHRSSHRWTAKGDAARSVLPLIEPFLIIKRDRAIWAIEALEIQAARRGGKHPLAASERLSQLRDFFDASHVH